MPPKNTTKYSPALVIEALHKTKGMAHVAARMLGCSPTTIYKMCKKYATVAAAKESEEGMMLDTAELKVYEAILAGEMTVVMWYLRLKGKDRGYVERHEQEISGRGGGAIEVKAFEYGAAIAGITPRPVGDSESSGDDEGVLHGAEVRQDYDVR